MRLRFAFMLAAFAVAGLVVLSFNQAQADSPPSGIGQIASMGGDTAANARWSGWRTALPSPTANLQVAGVEVTATPTTKGGMHAGAAATPTATATPYSGPPTITYSAADTDGDGCPDIMELGDNQTSGGRRDFENPYDYFNPTHDGQNRVDDILKVVGQYFKDDTDTTPGFPPFTAGYNQDTDRTALIGGNAWNLGPPNGQQRVDDILAQVKQYFHDCGPMEDTVDVAQDCNGNVREASGILDEQSSILEGCVISRDGAGNIINIVHEKVTLTKGEIASINCTTCMPGTDPGAWYHTWDEAYREQLWPPGRVCSPSLFGHRICTPQTVIISFSMLCAWDYYRGTGFYNGATVNHACEPDANVHLPWHEKNQGDVQCCTPTAGSFEVTARVQALFQYGDAPFVLEQRTWHLYCKMGPWEQGACGGY